MAEAPAVPPEGVYPIFLRGNYMEKFGLKFGPGLDDVHPHLEIKKEDIMNDIQVGGALSDWFPGKKVIESFPGEEILVVYDPNNTYGEQFNNLVYYTEDAYNAFKKAIQDKLDAEEAERQAILAAEEAERQAAWERANVVYEDKPMMSRPWVSAHAADIEADVAAMSHQPLRDPIVMEVSRAKRTMKQSYRFVDRPADFLPYNIEFRASKDKQFTEGFMRIRERDCSFQVAPATVDIGVQSTWFKPMASSLQYNSISTMTEPLDGEKKDNLLEFLERITVRLENALQQNESVDIFHETFHLADDDGHADTQNENELLGGRIFNYNEYCANMSIAALDWMPKQNGIVAVAPVRNISFDNRIIVSGQTQRAYILLWDFKQLVKPQIVMESQYEIYAFRFNRTDPLLVAGGTITGQVVLWDIADALAAANKRSNRGGGPDNEDDDKQVGPVIPKFVSHVDYSHKKCVSDLFWLPPNTQINYKGQIVAPEYLDSHSYQFVTIAGDGMVLVWDIRFEQIAADELRHIGRSKHIAQEKTGKSGQEMKALWSPIYRCHLKRPEGVGELSLAKASYSGHLRQNVASKTSLPGDFRSHLMIGTEEGDVMFTDLSGRGDGDEQPTKKGDDDEGDNAMGGEFVKWLRTDHSRPAVGFQQSPFFPDIMLSVCDWSFHIWRVGDEKPLFESPIHDRYLTAGIWSPTRPAVLFVGCADGHIQVWDFTDSSFHWSLELKATTPQRLTTMEFLESSKMTKTQLLAVGDDNGNLHIFEMPRNLMKAAAQYNEEDVMRKFLEREQQHHKFFTEVIASSDASGMRAQDEIFGVSVDSVATPSPGGAPAPAPAPAAATSTGASSETKKDEPVEDAAAVSAKKEDEDFEKLEEAFLTELGLVSEGEKTEKT